ncbi:MAG: glycosyltransferase [Micropruina sp.]|uniref:glycosyltransferase family 2 protein n=1 Tax=Micropruina sp. TaxID=2737536 RepID=UPI0039E29F95
MPAVSVIVPVRNGERRLRESLGDIAAQTLTDLEIIVVDDGSTDATAAIVGEMADADARVRLVAGPAMGSAGAARNAGLAEATGNYLAFLDADDRFAPMLLEELHAKAVMDDADIVATRFRVADESTGDVSPVEWGVRLNRFPRRTPLAPEALGDHLFLAVSPAPWNKLLKASFVARTGLRFQPLRRTNDLYFASLAMAQAQRISYVESYGIDYRTGHSTSLQATLHESPLDFVEALTAIRADLERIGRWPGLERAFVNLVVEVSLTALRKAGTAVSFATVHEALRSDVLPRFGVTGRPDDYFLRHDYPAQLDAIARRTSTELLFDRLRQAQQQAATARADAHTALLAMIGATPDATTPHNHSPDPSPPEAAIPHAVVETPDGAVPDVSVIIPVHNTEAYLRDCLASVLGQNGVDLEVICVDDGSTDASGTLLARIAASDARVRVLTVPHGGQSVARNAALDLARGRYLCFLDSDDHWGLDGLADLVGRASADDLDLLGFDAEASREPGVDDHRWRRMATYYQRPGDYSAITSGVALLARMNARKHYRASACLYLVRRSIVEQASIRFLPGISYEDNLFTFEVMLAVRRAAHVPVQLYRRRVRQDSIMGTASRAVAARGYFVCAVQMFRLVHGRRFEPDVAEQVGAVIHRMLQQARDQAVRLGSDLLAQLGAIDSGADAQAMHRLLVEAHTEAKFRRRPAPATPSPAPPAVDLPRLVAGVRRRIRRRLRRVLPARRAAERGS